LARLITVEEELARTEFLYAQHSLSDFPILTSEDGHTQIAAFDAVSLQSHKQPIVIGIDEVGRGAVAGPLTVAAVCLPAEPKILYLNDSKKLSASKRELLCEEISKTAVAIGIAHISPIDIDTMGMARALRRAMLSALSATGLEPDLVLIDGNPMHIHERERCIVKGDSKVACIAAASIVAKVTRDALMTDAGKKQSYAVYGFSANKGYASSEHIASIRKHGLSDMHRVSFCGNFLQESLF
jgi:ribonuclease HII